MLKAPEAFSTFSFNSHFVSFVFPSRPLDSLPSDCVLPDSTALESENQILKKKTSLTTSVLK